MRTLVFSLLVVAGFPIAELPKSTSDAIRAEAQPASVELTPLADEDRSIRLPSLGFALRVEPICAGEARPRSLSISVADTRLHFSASDLAETPVVETTLTLPQSQLGPVKVENFCRVGKHDGLLRFLLEDAYTARLSLRCGPDERQTIVYATLALDVDLLCRRAATTAGPAPDQDSVSSESF